MKKAIMFFAVLFLSISIYASDFYNMKVRIFAPDTKATINQLTQKGIDDIVSAKPGIFIDAIISNKKETILSSMGLSYKILIPNLTKRWNEMNIKGRYAFGPYYTYWEMKDELDSIHNEFPNLTTAKYSI
ncbi:hypothetical protein J7J58_04895 [candidate division WOR-3 bacterium]|nr:hypothetical protein [candidate division WOR-3 bacterium]